MAYYLPIYKCFYTEKDVNITTLDRTYLTKNGQMNEIRYQKNHREYEDTDALHQKKFTFRAVVVKP